MELAETAGRTVGTGVDAGGGVGDGVMGGSEGGAGGGDGDFFGDGLGDALDFFFGDGAFAFFFFAGVGVFFGVPFFFLADAFRFGVGDLLGLGEDFASDFSSDETCAEAGAAVKTLAISRHKQNRATAHVTKEISGRLRRRSRILERALVFAAQNRV